MIRIKHSLIVQMIVNLTQKFKKKSLQFYRFQLQVNRAEFITEIRLE